jgi:hypothetical protein
LLSFEVDTVTGIVGHEVAHLFEHFRAIEQQTALLPSDAFLWVAGAAIATSLIVKLLGSKPRGAFCRTMDSHDF